MSTIELSASQWAVFDSPARFRILAAGRRFGKSFLAICELVRDAWQEKERLVWYISPTYRQSKQIAWSLLKRVIVPYVTAVNETDLSVRLRNGSVIALRGADNPDSLRGVGLDLVIFDEAADIHPDTWAEVIRPALADRQGRGLFIGTPRSYNWFYDLFVQGAEHTAQWASWQFTTAEGGHVPQAEIESARETMGKEQFEQEFLASFVSLTGRVYKSFSRQDNVRADVADLKGELWVAMDFNVSPMSACIGNKAGDQLHIFDEIELMNSNTPEMIEEIQRRYPDRKITAYPDPSGKARKTSAPVGQTDLALLRAAGFRVVAPNVAPAVVDRVNEVNALACNAKGTRRLFVHPKCKALIKGLEGLTYQEGTSVVDKSSGLDHMPDALGYLIHCEFPIVIHQARVTKLIMG